MEPDTRYARVDAEQVAYQIVGDGPPDLVISAGTYGSIDLDWDDPMVVSMYPYAETQTHGRDATENVASRHG